jgi:low affinity Fe/Cu permease
LRTARQPARSPRAASGRDESGTGPSRRRSFFNRFAERAAHVSGRPATFAAALAAVVLWAILGPTFGFSDTWQLVINTSTTIVTFLMVFLIQNTQNRDARAVQIKLDELIRAIEGAHNALLDLEDLNDDELATIRESYAHLAQRARESLGKGECDTGSPDIES